VAGDAAHRDWDGQSGDSKSHGRLPGVDPQPTVIHRLLLCLLLVCRRRCSRSRGADNGSHDPLTVSRVFLTGC